MTANEEINCHNLCLLDYEMTEDANSLQSGRSKTRERCAQVACSMEEAKQHNSETGAYNQSIRPYSTFQTCFLSSDRSRSTVPRLLKILIVLSFPPLDALAAAISIILVILD